MQHLHLLASHRKQSERSLSQGFPGGMKQQPVELCRHRGLQWLQESRRMCTLHNQQQGLPSMLLLQLRELGSREC